MFLAVLHAPVDGGQDPRGRSGPVVSSRKRRAARLGRPAFGRITDGDPIPRPSARRTGEHRVAVPPTMAAKAVLVLAFRDSGLSRVAFARRLGVDDKVVRRLLDPRHATAANRLHKALRQLGRELVVESTAA